MTNAVRDMRPVTRWLWNFGTAYVIVFLLFFCSRQTPFTDVPTGARFTTIGTIQPLRT